MNVLLIYPDHKPDPLIYGESEGLEKHFSNCEPLGLEYIASSVKDLCNRIVIADLRFEGSKLDTLLEAVKPDIVGITGYSMHVPRIREILNQVKKANSEVINVVGGIHASLMPEDYFTDSVDFVVKGDGRHSFRSLVKSIQKQDSDILLKGSYSRTPKGFVFTETDENDSGSDSILPDRSFTSQVRHNYKMLGMEPLALMRTSYGCPFRCSFCSLWGLNGGKYHLHEFDEVLEDLDSIKEKNIHFVDDEPWLKPGRMKSLAEEICKSGIEKNFLLYARIDTLVNRTDIIEKWMKAGLTKVLIGVEAVTSRELEEYGKKITLSQIEQAYKVLTELNLESVSLFIVNPLYQEKDFKRLKRFILRHQVPSPMFTILTPLPGTEMMDDKFTGIKSLDNHGRPDWYQWDLQHPVTETRLPREKFIAEYKSLRTINL